MSIYEMESQVNAELYESKNADSSANDIDQKYFTRITSDHVEDNNKSAGSVISWFEALLRHFKLQILGQIKFWRAPTERRKVAVYQDRKVAIVHYMLHIPPLAGAITILALFAKRYFIGYQFTQAPALQFASKLLEILMQASIAEIMLTYIRLQALKGQVPLGSIMAPYHTSQLSYLWSLEVWSTMTSQTLTKRRKILFLALVPAMVVLAGVVGPSAAITMIPRRILSEPVYSSRIVFDRPVPELFPPRMDAGAPIYGDPESILDSLGFNSPKVALAVPGARPSRLLLISQNWTQMEEGIDEPFYSAMARMPILLAANTLDLVLTNVGLRIMQDKKLADMTSISEVRENLIPSTYMFHPTTVARSLSQANVTEKTWLRYIVDDGMSVQNFMTVKSIFENAISRNSSWIPAFDPAPPLWYQSPQTNSSSVLGIFLQPMCPDRFPISAVFSHSRLNCFTIQTWTISAFWEFSRHEIITTEGASLLRTEPIRNPVFDTTGFHNPIVLHPENIPALQSPRFARSGMPNEIAAYFVRILADLTPEVRVPPLDTPGLDTYGPMSTPLLIQDNKTQFKIEVVQSGYGYEISSGSILLSVIILGIYCLITISYLFYLLVTGTTSTAWNSMTELLILALQSRRPTRIENASVGVESMRTFEKPVGIWVNEVDELEIVFASDRDLARGELRKLVANKAY